MVVSEESEVPKSVSLGEFADRLRNFGTVVSRDSRESFLPAVFVYPGNAGFRDSCTVRETLGFEEIHSGSECNPMACAWTPNISLRNSQSLSQRCVRELAAPFRLDPE
jgi:hypothetical protein